MLNTDNNKTSITDNTEENVTDSTTDTNVSAPSMINVPHYEADGRLDFYNFNEVDYVFPLHVQVIHPENDASHECSCGRVMCSSQKQRGQRTVQDWQQVDHIRLHCSALRNKLEEQLGETNFEVITLQT